MERIESFCVDHTKINEGIYISRRDGDIVTYDLRMAKPNTPPFLPNAAIHTIEHLFATYVRNSRFSGGIIYFGPMGCRTGFYLLVRDISHEDAISLVQETFKFISEYTGEIPGNTAIECGNYLEHDLETAKRLSAEMSDKLNGYSVTKLQYIQE